MTHAEAIAAAEEVGCTMLEARALAAIAWLESRYATAAYLVPVELAEEVCAPGDVRHYGFSRPPCVSRILVGALGAAQARAGYRGSCAWALDSSPREAPSGKTEPWWYATSYRTFPVKLDAWRDLKRVALDSRPSVRRSANDGDWEGVSATLYDTHYYEGTSLIRGVNICRHFARLADGLYKAKLELGEMARRKTLRVGSTGEDVTDWQRLMGVRDDGKFGPVTKAVTRAWQKNHCLDGDGIVGPATWCVAMMGRGT